MRSLSGASLSCCSRFLSRLECDPRHEITANTETLHRVRLSDIEFNWLATPPLVMLTAASNDPTPSQIDALERFARARTGQQFALRFDVSQLVEVRPALAARVMRTTAPQSRDSGKHSPRAERIRLSVGLAVL